MNAPSIAAPRRLDAVAVARLGAWTFVAVSFALLLEPAGVAHWSPHVVCHWPPGTPCELVGYSVSDLFASLPAFVLRSGVLLILGAEGLARRRGEAHLEVRPLVAACALVVAAASVLFYGAGLVKLLYVGAWHVEQVFFVTSIAGGLVAALGLWWMSVRLRGAA